MRQKMLSCLVVLSLPFLVTSCLSDDADAYFGHNEGERSHVGAPNGGGVSEGDPPALRRHR